MRVLVVTNMYPQPDMPAFGTFVKEQVDSLSGNGVEIDVLFVNGSKMKLNYLWAFPRLWARILTRRYDLIHAHYVFSGIIARAQILYPVVLTHHGSQVFLSWQAPLCRLISKFVDRTLVMSPEMKERGRLGKSEIIPCGIDFDFLKPMSGSQAREELGLPKDKKLVVFIGEYYKWNKRWDIAQEAVRLLKEKITDVELILVSKQPHDVIPKYLSACDVLVLVSDSEGSPMVIKEAMACNLPIVAVPVGDVAEVIAGTEGCYLCSQDPHDVAEKLEQALHWGKRTTGRDNITHLDNRAISQKIIAVYRDVISQRKGRWWRYLLKWRKNNKVTSNETQH